MGYQVAAFVPKTDPQDPAKHEFRFRSPFRDPLPLCESSYRFELSHHGLDTTDRQPVVDRGFSSVEYSVEEWSPDPDNYSTFLELPTPDAIRYIPPLHPALFASEDDGIPRLATVPLNHVLEYTVRDADDIRLRLKNAPGCVDKHKKELQDQRPLSSADMWKEYENLHNQLPDQAEHPTLSQRPYVDRWLKRYSHVYFLGVGLPPHTDPQGHIQERREHGVNFFNYRLLPGIFQHQPPPPGSKLKKVGREVLPCDVGQSITSSPSMTPVAWQDSMPQPRLFTVASNENCSSPAATATSHS
jgi:hypothetical protein